jgi:hypothetical protein
MLCTVILYHIYNYLLVRENGLCTVILCHIYNYLPVREHGGDRNPHICTIFYP